MCLSFEQENTIMYLSWLRAARLQLHTIGFTPFLLGNIAAWYEQGHFNWMRLYVSVIIGLLIHLVTAFFNDIADIRTDGNNASRSLFSGGSGVIVEGLLQQSDLEKAAILAVFSSIFLTCILVFMLQVHWGIFLFVGWGLISGIGYSLPPLKIAYRGGGEFLVMVTYSVALVWSGYFVQAGPIHSPLPWILSFPIGFAVFALITITQFPDMEADRQAQKRSLVLLIGEPPAIGLVAVAIALSVLTVLIALLTGAIPVVAGFLSLLCLPLAYGLLKIVKNNEGGMCTYLKLSQGTLLLALWLGLAPAFGLIVDHWFR